MQVEGPGNNAVGTLVTTTTYNYTDDSTYDVNGDPGSYHTTSIGLPLTVTDEKGNTTHYRYDAYGNVIIEIDPDGRRTDTAYNSADQPVTIIQPPSIAGGRRAVRESERNTCIPAVPVGGEFSTMIRRLLISFVRS